MTDFILNNTEICSQETFSSGTIEIATSTCYKVLDVYTIFFIEFLMCIVVGILVFKLINYFKK